MRADTDAVSAEPPFRVSEDGLSVVRTTPWFRAPKGTGWVVTAIVLAIYAAAPFALPLEAYALLQTFALLFALFACLVIPYTRATDGIVDSSDRNVALVRRDETYREAAIMTVECDGRDVGVVRDVVARRRALTRSPSDYRVYVVTDRQLIELYFGTGAAASLACANTLRATLGLAPQAAMLDEPNETASILVVPLIFAPMVFALGLTYVDRIAPAFVGEIYGAASLLFFYALGRYAAGRSRATMRARVKDLFGVTSP